MKRGIALATILAVGSLSAGLSPSSRPIAAPAVQATSAPQLQLADEITRRLRRIGFNYIHVFNARPADRVGDPC